LRRAEEIRQGAGVQLGLAFLPQREQALALWVQFALEARDERKRLRREDVVIGFTA
jgi:hypothetical protein